MGKIEELNKELERIEMELQKDDAITPERKYHLLMKRERIKESMQPEIDVSDDDFGAILNCAVRYAMGRCTYMPTLVISYIKPLLPFVTIKTLHVFREDYERSMRMYSKGMRDVFGDESIDKPEWDDFYIAVKEELKERMDSFTGDDDRPMHTMFAD